jgi:hypothetical protein
MSQIPEGGAYAALIITTAPPPAPYNTNVPAEYFLNDFSGLYKPHDWRLEASQGIQGLRFHKWKIPFQLEVACQSTASDATVAKLNNLLQSWRFDAIPPP